MWRWSWFGWLTIATSVTFCEFPRFREFASTDKRQLQAAKVAPVTPIDLTTWKPSSSRKSLRVTLPSISRPTLTSPLPRVKLIKGQPERFDRLHQFAQLAHVVRLYQVGVGAVAISAFNVARLARSAQN
jgi:hypothetical protein